MKYILNTQGITVFIKNKPHKIEKGNPLYAQIIAVFDIEFSEQDAAMAFILVNQYNPAKEGFEISGNSVKFRGTELPEALAKKVISMHAEELPLDSFVKFWENLQQNTSATSITQLYDFLKYKELPITEDGHFLAYKGLSDDFWSIRGNKNSNVVKGQVNEDGNIFNGVGSVLEVVRSSVDDDRSNHCSFGLHVGSLNYAQDFSKGKIVVVKVNPKDVVSVPTDYSCQKCRVCGYTVCGVFEEEIVAPVVDAENKPVISHKKAKAKISNKERELFIERVQLYLFNQYDKGSVSVRRIQNSFSPEYPSSQRVLDAVEALGFVWEETEDGIEVKFR
jgi:hypothetical protein